MELSISGRMREWYLLDWSFIEVINAANMVRIACFIRYSSPAWLHKGGSKEMI